MDSRGAAYDKTETLLYRYRDMEVIINTVSKQKGLRTKVKLIQAALDSISKDKWYEIIPLTYFDGLTREEVAEYFNTTPSNITHHKQRLVNRIIFYLFPDKIIDDL